MNNGTRLTLRVLGVLLVCALLAAAWWHVQTRRPSESPSEARARCHRILTQGHGAPHDAFIELCDIGDAESVPILIAALKRLNPAGRDTVICTIGHCGEALRRLTGEDFGLSPDAWSRWWTEVGSMLPSEHFHPRPTEVAEEKDGQPSPIPFRAVR